MKPFVKVRELIMKSTKVFAFITYDKVSANTANSVPKTSKFQSGHLELKMVLNT